MLPLIVRGNGRRNGNMSSISIKSIAVENGKGVKGTLSIFADEYVFDNKRTSVNWELATVVKTTTRIKGLVLSAEKPCITIEENGLKSPQFVMDNNDLTNVLSQIQMYADEINRRRLEKEAKKEKEERQKKHEEEEKRKKEAEEQVKIEKERQKKE